MAFTPQNVIDTARLSLNDAAKGRYSDADALKYVNGGMSALAMLRPDLFIKYQAVATVAETARQDLATEFPNALKLIAIDSTEAGDPIDECDKTAMDEFYPLWRQETADTPVNWMRGEPDGDPKQGSATKYFLFPPPPDGLKVMARFSEAPAALGLSDTVPLQEAYREALVHYVIFRAESMDDEHVVTQRALQSLQTFMQGIGLARDAKVMMDKGKPT